MLKAPSAISKAHYPGNLYLYLICYIYILCIISYVLYFMYYILCIISYALYVISIFQVHSQVEDLRQQPGEILYMYLEYL